MKRQHVITCALCSLLALSAGAAEEAASASTAIDFGTLTPSGDGSFVDIRVNRGLIQMATRVAQASEPEIARVLAGLRSVRVNVLGIDDQNRQTVESRVLSVRKQLEDQRWERVVTVKQEEEDVGIYAKLKGEESIEGMAVTVINKKEAVLVHVDGSIRPEELAWVGKRLNIEPLEKLGRQIDKDQ